ncbi:hypothetical protein N2152v2_000220 [Parachlorella kessleri]
MGLAALLASLKAHSLTMPPVYVVDAGLDHSSKLRLAQVAPIHWVDAPLVSNLQSKLPATAGYPSQYTWLKLFASKLLPAGLEKVLYLDSDMLVLADISKLFKVPLEGRLLAAVRDFGMPCGHAALEQFGWRMDMPYFNAGLLLLDLKKFGLLSSRIECKIASWGSKLAFHDQDLFNMVCLTDGWVELDYKWNAQGLGTYAAFRTRPQNDKPQLFSVPELERLTADPAVVPYSAKPWSYLCNHPFKFKWLYFLDRTPWAGWRPSWATLVQVCTCETQEFADKVAQQHPEFPVGKFLEAVAANLAETAGCDQGMQCPQH